MPESHVPNPQTIVLVGLFAIVYLVLLLRKTARHELDLYDLFMLSTVAVLPALLVFVPSISESIAATTGVAFPFVVMFGLLFVVSFMIIHRLTIKVHQLEAGNRLMIQELGLLRTEMQAGPRQL